MEKFFDFMEGDFIWNLLKCMMFCITWINWIKECISIVIFFIIINGRPKGFFYPSRGLRQGDPLSPFPFIMGAEVFSKLIAKEESLGNSANLVLLSHTLFVDDLILFGSATNQNAQSFLNYIEKYSSWSSQKVHSGKSSIQYSQNTHQQI